jgi:hypothetical protein
MTKETKVKLAWGVAFVAVPLLIAVPLWINNNSTDPAALRRGHILDFCQALFSGWAFLGLIITLFYQREELGLQREELRLQRKELRLTRKENERQGKTLAQQDAALQRQAQAMTKQVFDSGFYQLLSAFTQARDNTEVTNGVRMLRGHYVYEEIWDLMRTALSDDSASQASFLNMPLAQYFEREQLHQWSTTTKGTLSREEVLTIRLGLLAHAITNRAISIHQRILLSLLEMIRASAFPPAERGMYYQIVVSVMSREEIIISAYYTFVSARGAECAVLLGESGILDLLKAEPLAKPGDFALICERTKPTLFAHTVASTDTAQ